MSKVSISEAIKMAGISRSYFYKKYVNTGILSVLTEDNKKLIDVSELIRVFGSIQLSEQEIPEKDKVVDLLETQLKESQKRETEAKEREVWLKSQIDELRHQQNNLLENKLKPKRKKFLGIF
jgi:hypothetical protein